MGSKLDQVLRFLPIREAEVGRLDLQNGCFWGDPTEGHRSESQKMAMLEASSLQRLSGSPKVAGRKLGISTSVNCGLPV